jgi:hypothetical protein
MQHLVVCGPWDIIIDDGSHVPSHVIFSLYMLWPSVRPGGMHIVEDLDTNYWPNNSMVYGYSLSGTGIGAPASSSVVAKLHQLVDVLARHQIGARQLTIMPGDDELCSVEWGMNLVKLHKCGPEDEPRPPHQEQRFDEARMTAWLQNARKTNPL